jgi:hypothetical protein
MELNRMELNRMELNRMELNRMELNRADMVTACIQLHFDRPASIAGGALRCRTAGPGE